MVIALLFFLIAGHFLMDFSLQTDVIASCKCPRSVHPATKAVPWYYWLTAHTFMHGATVGVVFRWFGFDWNSVVAAAVAETVIHWGIDYGKCRDWYGIHLDQAFHILCKVIWCGLAIGSRSSGGGWA